MGGCDVTVHMLLTLMLGVCDVQHSLAARCLGKRCCSVYRLGVGRRCTSEDSCEKKKKKIPIMLLSLFFIVKITIKLLEIASNRGKSSALSIILCIFGEFVITNVKYCCNIVLKNEN